MEIPSIRHVSFQPSTSSSLINVVDYVMAVLWSGVEVPVAMICACFPAMRRLFVRIFPNVFTTTHLSTTDSQRPSKSWYTAPSQLNLAENKNLKDLGRSDSVKPLVLPDFELDLMPYQFEGPPTVPPKEPKRTSRIKSGSRAERIRTKAEEPTTTSWYDSGEE